MNEDLSIENKILGKTFFWMFLGLLGSGIIAWYSYYSGLFINIVESGSFNLLLIVELAVVIIFNLLFKKLSPTLVRHYVFCILNG